MKMNKYTIAAMKIVIFACKMCCLICGFLAVWLIAALIMPDPDTPSWYILVPIIVGCLWAGFKSGDNALMLEDDLYEEENEE